VEQAHALGRPAAAHATEREIARRMVDAGVDILVHSISNEPIDPELLRLID
jgi:imidazolonepropionase-like amidohydrolase